MKGNIYLADAINYNDIQKGSLNMITCNCGAGKSYWAFNVLSKQLGYGRQMLFLIDTANGKEQFIKEYSGVERYDLYSEKLLDEGIIHFSDNITIATYAKFGTLAEQNTTGYYVKCPYQFIVCDEIHNLIRFGNMPTRNGEINAHRKAKERLEWIITQTDTIVYGLTATPAKVYEQFYTDINPIELQGDIKQYEAKETVYYSDIDSLIFQLKGKKGIVYFTHITSMLDFIMLCGRHDMPAICIWSINNNKYPMDEKQKEVRRNLIEKREFPKDYDILVINASCETGLSIEGYIDFIIVNSSDNDIITQVKGRYRGDIETLYLYSEKNALLCPPACYINVALFKEDKEKLCQTLNIQSNGRLVKWATISKLLVEQGYIIEDKRSNNKRFSIIRPPVQK